MKFLSMIIEILLAFTVFLLAKSNAKLQERISILEDEVEELKKFKDK